jgi:hypothetical protein
LADFRSIAGFEFTDRGDLSTGVRELCKGDGESDSDFDTTLLTLLTLGVACDALFEFSDSFDLSNQIHNVNNIRSTKNQNKHTITIVLWI